MVFSEATRSLRESSILRSHVLKLDRQMDHPIQQKSMLTQTLDKAVSVAVERGCKLTLTCLALLPQNSLGQRHRLAADCL